MKKFIIISISALLIITTILVFTLSFNKSLSTGQVVNEVNKSNYTYTKAICDTNNFCQDHIIVCNGAEIISVTPISGAFAQFKPDFIDPRDEKSKETLCE